MSSSLHPLFQVDRRPQRPTPGPNAYNLQSSFINKYDFNTGASRVFRLPIAVQMDGPKHITPAPNQYDVCVLIIKADSGCNLWDPVVYFVSFFLSVQVSCVRRVSISSVVGTAPFLSRTTRDSFCPNKNVPSPGLLWSFVSFSLLLNLHLNF